MEAKRFRALAVLSLTILIMGLISGCATKQKYIQTGVVSPIKDWPDYTQDKDPWGNTGIGVKGYFYPVLEEQEPEEVVRKEIIAKPVVKVVQPPVIKKEYIPTPPPVAKKEGEKEWCPKKARTIIPKEKRVLVADFNSGNKPNNMGYDFGAWDRDPEDYSQTCIDSFTRETRDGTGFSLQLFYDVDSPISAYNGFWCELDGDIDYSVFTKVRFWVKGDPGRGYTKVFKVELKNCVNEVARFYVTNVTDKWQEIVIPFTEFRGLTEWSLLREFVIVFEDRVATKKEGAIYIDDIYFEK